jgi:tRNA dimethylallyltransferase
MASKPKPPLALIAGPTASGKSALALEYAQQIGGVIVNADSAQIYAGIPVLSAAPTAEELGRVEHRLYGVLDGTVPCSAADWAEMAKREVADIHASGRTPVLVGGTGLYLRTLLDGIAPVPQIDPEVRRRVRETAVDENREKLEALDPDAAERLRRGDTARIARALEVILSTGRTLAEWQKQREGGIAAGVALHAIILLPPRDWLYSRCDERFVRMFEGGAIEEVERLLANNLNPNLPILRAIGVPAIGAYLRGELTREQSIAAGQQATRRYAKRQYTWFAHQPPADWPRFREALDATSMAQALELL